ncbi:MFS transporter [Streptomyces mangrovisoli]|uniref:Major facilitator superfamily (MFS) profile domain-containing protein n=1 Tax=Streptomyces mangrovisoli TaxID=1428628 RepID=A0A1J4NR97_9ACTN|nr:MFS transporter [Streptomyces mangrovisoli]OIJ63678.1 hypothetical protein WN71_033230 [Streptomyces mangrovisoli]
MPENTCPRPLIRWWIFATVLVADVLDLLSTTITNIAAPSIVHDLHAPADLAPWLGAAYALALGSALVLGARLGDRYGTRRIFLIGLLGFTAASLGCAMATGAITIVSARVTQGAFGALLIPQGFSIVLAAFPRDELGKVFGLFGPLMGASSISGPVLAGLLLRADPWGLGWRSVFLVNAVLGAALLAVAGRILPRRPASREAAVAPLPSILLMLGLLAVLGGLISGGNGHWGVRDIGLIGIGAVVLAAFAVHQTHHPDPLLARALFRSRSFVAGLVVGSVFFAATAGLLYVTSLYLQEGRGLGALATAGAMAPMSLGIIVASFTARGLIESLGRRLVATGLTLVGAGALAFLLTVHGEPARYWLLTLPLFVCGLGMGCCFGSVFAVTLGDVTPEQAGSASGTLNAVQQLANSAGSALISTLYLAHTAGDGPGEAVTASLVAVLAIVVVCLACLPLLPAAAAPDSH